MTQYPDLNSSRCWLRTAVFVFCIPLLVFLLGSYSYPAGAQIGTATLTIACDATASTATSFDFTVVAPVFKLRNENWAPAGLEVDSTGKVYVSDRGVHAILLFADDGTFVDSWQAPGLYYPHDVAVDSDGYVYVPDHYYHHLLKFNPDGTLASPPWGSYGQSAGQLNYPISIGVDAAGDVYVLEVYNYRVQKFSDNGVFERIWGWDVVYGAPQEFEICTPGLTCQAGARDGGKGGQIYAQGMAVGSDRVYVSDTNNHRVQVFDLEGNFQFAWGWDVDQVTPELGFEICDNTDNCKAGSPGAGEGQFHFPYYIALDGFNNAYVTDGSNNRVQVFDRDGKFLMEWGRYGHENGQLDFPYGIAVNGRDVYVTEYIGKSMQKYSLLDASLGDNEVATFSGLAPGEYMLKEFVPDGWLTPQISCSGDQPISAGSHMLTLAAGDDVTCTFSNSLPTVANDDTYSIAEDFELSVAAPGVLVNDSDVNNLTLTADKVSDPAHGSLILNSDGSFTYQPYLDYNGPDSFTYKATGGTADSNVATVSITLAPVNDLPLAPGDLDGLLAAGWHHTCAIRTDGSANCWGYDYGGLLTDQPGPFTQLSGGSQHTCGLLYDGSIFCWGDNTYGQSGSPTGEFTQVSAGGHHSCGLKPDGSIVCWGDDTYGQSADHAGPFIEVNADGSHTCGLKADGSLLCWGYNNRGQTIPPVGETFVEVDAGTTHTCGRKADGHVLCWGENWMGQANPNDGPFRKIVANYVHNCGLKPDGSVDCWGYSYCGNAEFRAGPFVEFDAGHCQTCGLVYQAGTYQDVWLNQVLYDEVFLPAGSVYCWGASDGRADSQFGPFGNFPPIATDEDVSVAIMLRATDIDGDALTFAVVDGPQHGTLSGTAPDLTYTPDLNYNGADNFNYRAFDGELVSNVATVEITVQPVNDAPAASWSAGPETPLLLGTVVNATATFSDPDEGDSHTCTWQWADGTVDGPTPCSVGSITGSHVYSAVGSYTVTFSVIDNVGVAVTLTAPVVVIYPFTGFFPPVDNLPVFNSVKGGSAVPIKFSLDGDYGLNILATGYPKSIKIACDSGVPVYNIEETVSAGSSSLQYDSVTGWYTYVWKTDKVWANSCRQLQLRLVDGMSHLANFKFK